MSPEQFEAQRRWLEAELGKPRTTVWTVMCAHHPLFTNGRAGDDASAAADCMPLQSGVTEAQYRHLQHWSAA